MTRAEDVARLDAIEEAVEEILWEEFGPWRMDDGGPTIASVAQKIVKAVKAQVYDAE